MMRIAMLVAAAVAGLSGCASPAHYVEKSGDGGVVAIPADTDSWPNHNRREAIALIEKHVGPNYEIVEEKEVVTGTRTNNNQQVQRDKTFNTTNFIMPAEKDTIQTTTTTSEVTEWRIAYRKRVGPVVNDINNRGVTTGLTPAGGMAPGAGLPPALPAGGR